MFNDQSKPTGLCRVFFDFVICTFVSALTEAFSLSIFAAISCSLSCIIWCWRSIIFSSLSDKISYNRWGHNNMYLGQIYKRYICNNLNEMSSVQWPNTTYWIIEGQMVIVYIKLGWKWMVQKGWIFWQHDEVQKLLRYSCLLKQFPFNSSSLYTLFLV